MIISEQWLRDWVDVDLDAQGIADCLTHAGLEVEGVAPVVGQIDNLVVGEVLDVIKHPDADRLSIATVDTGAERLTIVCGAPNVRQGLLVAVAKAGAALPNGMKIKNAEVRGVASQGMLCSAAELGLEEQSDGLLELDADAEPGQRVDDTLHLDDKLIDIDLTPNRGDCLSVQGVARELKVLADASYHPLQIDIAEPTIEASIEIKLHDYVACPRYLGRVIRGINPQAVTPLWMRERLRRSGVRPISPVVDISNYVMLELGQPMHAFDLAKLHDRIEVRQSTAGETITLLDESSATLDDDTLVIADAEGPIAIAGVMGGIHSAIDDSTTDIVLEAAHFTRKSAAGKARRYGLHTESSFRFERGVDPQLPPLAIQRATQLVLEICGGEAGPVCEQKNDAGLQNKATVDVRLARLSKLLGMQLQHREVDDILNRVAEEVVATRDSWCVTPPSYRFDIEYEADLVEEVARVKGYDEIPTAMPRIAPRAHAVSEARVSLHQLRQSMVARDYHEIVTYSFIDPQAQKTLSEEAPLELSNPLAENMSVMRTSLLPGMLAALEFNANRQRERIRLFEIGATYHSESGNIVEKQKLGVIATGPRAPLQWGLANDINVDFYDLKNDLSSVLALTGSKEPFIFKEFEHIAMQPGQVSQICRTGPDGTQVDLGWLGRLHPSQQKKMSLQLPVYAFELDVEKALAAELPVFSEVSRFPSVKRDLSVVVGDAVAAGDMIDAIKVELGAVLSKVVVFDVYRGEGVEDRNKSVSLSLVMRHADKTMTDSESEKMVSAALAVLAKEFGAVLRS